MIRYIYMSNVAFSRGVRSDSSGQMLEKRMQQKHFRLARDGEDRLWPVAMPSPSHHWYGCC